VGQFPDLLGAIRANNSTSSSPLLSALSGEARWLIGGHLRQGDFRHGAILWDAESDAEQIFFPISGVISIRVPSGDGHRIEVATIGPEGAAGFHDGSGTIPVLTQAVVQAGGGFATIAAEAFHAAASECEELGRLAAVCEAWLLLQSQRTALCNAVHSADSRFCRWLLRTSDAVGSDTVRVTQETIAEALGIRRTTVNLIAQQLQWKATISCGRGKIAIRDRAGLESAACDCYSVLGPPHWPCELLRGTGRLHRIGGAASLSAHM
jgi:CRP-like cAMP-binding protein